MISTKRKGEIIMKKGKSEYYCAHCDIKIWILKTRHNLFFHSRFNCPKCNNFLAEISKN